MKKTKIIKVNSGYSDDELDDYTIDLLNDLEKELESKGSIDVDLQKAKITFRVLKKYLLLGKPYDIKVLSRKGNRPIKVKITKIQPPEPDHIDFSEIENQILQPIESPIEIENPESPVESPLEIEIPPLIESKIAISLSETEIPIPKIIENQYHYNQELEIEIPSISENQYHYDLKQDLQMPSIQENKIAISTTLLGKVNKFLSDVKQFFFSSKPIEKQPEKPIEKTQSIQDKIEKAKEKAERIEKQLSTKQDLYAKEIGKQEIEREKSEKQPEKQQEKQGIISTVINKTREFFKKIFMLLF